MAPPYFGRGQPKETFRKIERLGLSPAFQVFHADISQKPKGGGTGKFKFRLASS